jgi:hypothetical protein
MSEPPPWASPDGGDSGHHPARPTEPSRPASGEPAGPPPEPGQPPAAQDPGGSAPGWGAPPPGWDAAGRGPGWGAPPAGPPQWRQPSPQWGPNGPSYPQSYPHGSPQGYPQDYPQPYPPNGEGPEGQAGWNGWGGRGTGIIPLRPLSIYDIYDGAVRAIRANPRTMVGYSAVVIAIISLLGVAPQALLLSRLLSSPLSDPNRAPDDVHLSDFTDLIGASSLTLLVGALQLVLTTTIVSGLLIVAVDGAVRGRILTPGELWTACRGRLLALVGLAVVVLLAAPLVILVICLPGIILLFVPHTAVIGAILVGLGVVGGVIAYLALYFGYWAVAAPALLLERVGVRAALRRSQAVVRGSFWRVFGISLLSAVIVGIAKRALILPFSYLGGLVADVHGTAHFPSELVQLLVSDIGTIIGGAVLSPFSAGVVALLYLDLRMRREGLDLELLNR